MAYSPIRAVTVLYVRVIQKQSQPLVYRKLKYKVENGIVNTQLTTGYLLGMRYWTK